MYICIDLLTFFINISTTCHSIHMDMGNLKQLVLYSLHLPYLPRDCLSVHQVTLSYFILSMPQQVEQLLYQPFLHLLWHSLVL